MSTRENTLALVLLALIFLGGGGFVAYLLVLEPLAEKETASKALEKDIGDLEVKVAKLHKDAPRLQVANKRSLPTDRDIAAREYSAMMERLLRQAYGGPNPPSGLAIPGLNITEVKFTEPRTTAAPGQQPKKPAFTRVGLKIEFKKADMWTVHDFLTAYYKLNLLQQITALNIKREDEGSAAAKKGNTPDRKDLSVTLVTEALIVDEADSRRTLLPVAAAFAAVGGAAGFQAIALTPEASRGITPMQFVPVLATRTRDYSLIVRRDPFHGPYIDPPPEKPKVAVEAPRKEKEDISQSIVLGGVVPASDRTAYATIRDSYNPFNYVIDAGPKGITVQKFFFAGKNKKLDPTYPGKDMLVISDDGVSATSRTFRVIEVDADGLILLDLTPPSKAEPKVEAKGPPRAEAPMPRPGGPGRPGPGGPRPPGGPAVSAPLAGVVGAAAATATPPPRVYRWANGKPLRALTEIPSAEAQKILERVAAEGPVRLVAAAP
jgi:hypothetical protein